MSSDEISTILDRPKAAPTGISRERAQDESKRIWERLQARQQEAGNENLPAPLSQGERAVVPFDGHTPQFTTGVSRHHRDKYDNYDVAKAHILQALGSGIEDLDIWGSQICVAVFISPIINPKGLIISEKEQMEDSHQGKASLLLKVGPDAFLGNDGYMDKMFGVRGDDGKPIKGSGRDRLPRVGDWVFTNAASGIQISLCGEGASRPQGVDIHGRVMDLFKFDGWPCRIMDHDCLLGRLAKPSMVV